MKELNHIITKLPLLASLGHAEAASPSTTTLPPVAPPVAPAPVQASPVFDLRAGGLFKMDAPQQPTGGAAFGLRKVE